jgi:small subunit ribosomal protein S5
MASNKEKPGEALPEKKEKPRRIAKKKTDAPVKEEAPVVVEKPAAPVENAVDVVEQPAEGKDGGKEGRGDFSFEEKPEVWVPKTRLGEMVYSGEITSVKQLMESGMPIKEVGIIDKLLPGLKEEVVEVGRVQRVTDSGRRMRFRVVAVIGNEDGYVGIGEGKAKEVGPAIRKAIDKAKLSVRGIKRGCGSWECGCRMPHTVPVAITGKSGSVEVRILPAPKGMGLARGEIAKKILMLAGIKDAWIKTRGHTRTSINFAHAVYNALVNTNYVKLSDDTAKRLNIVFGSGEA